MSNNSPHNSEDISYVVLNTSADSDISTSLVSPPSLNNNENSSSSHSSPLLSSTQLFNPTLENHPLLLQRRFNNNGEGGTILSRDNNNNPTIISSRVPHMNTTANSDTAAVPPPTDENKVVPIYRRPRFIAFMSTLTANFLFPFINGVMLGLGEICANEFAFRMGWFRARSIPLHTRTDIPLGLKEQYGAGLFGTRGRRKDQSGNVHAHIYKSSFPEKSISSILTRARKHANVRKIVCVSEILDEAKEILMMSKNNGYFSYGSNVINDDNNHINSKVKNDDEEKEILPSLELSEMIAPCAGLHPVQPGFYDGSASKSVMNVSQVDGILQFIRENSQDLVGIGEVGLDYSPHVFSNALAQNPNKTIDDLKETQRQVLTRQTELSISYDLPLNVHSRSAGHHVLDLLSKVGAKKVVMHAFDGQVKYAKRGVEMGYYFSVPPSIIHSKQKQSLVSALPLSNLLLETDSPVLGPEPGLDNEPANIVFSAHEIARIKEVDVNQVVSHFLYDIKYNLASGV
ncbi:11017_t:CDS:2 [Ambispora gerdemannii]|uniref:11017_t:CDS:1 n=1 Tax=Ambispora gerdemannii TaxID=144530 RepID=A0A9N9CSQ9_9GLOM|nr:11017_t:CDS:2 [Ambispora gerdemannii]